MIQQLFKGRFSLLTMMFVALLALAGCQSKPQGLTPEQVALLQSQGFKLTDNGWEFGLSDKVLFGNNIGKLNPESTETVQKMGRALLSVGITKFRLDGHTDNYGEDSYNDQLSLRRADAVADLLASVGIPRANIETRGMGGAGSERRGEAADGRRRYSVGGHHSLLTRSRVLRLVMGLFTFPH
ncbi:OmpA family protein [Serratia marcescens]|uniref:OmpA family protein n=1 Tax=Serratia marcescens TaxID=615 RepID=UPI00311AA2F3